LLRHPGERTLVKGLDKGAGQEDNNLYFDRADIGL